MKYKCGIFTTLDKAVWYGLERVSSLNDYWKCLYRVSYLLGSYLQTHTYVRKREQERKKGYFQILHSHLGLWGWCLSWPPPKFWLKEASSRYGPPFPFFPLSEERTGAVIPPRALSRQTPKGLLDCAGWGSGNLCHL